MPYKIGFLLPNLDNPGGITVSVLTIANALEKIGHEIHLFPVGLTKERQLAEEKISIPLVKIGPKTHGLIYIRGGNHKASHIANMRDYLKSGYDKIKRFNAIEVFHYPIRSYEQFEKNIQNRKALLESGKKVSMGPHYRRWVKIYNNGGLEDEFNNNIVFNQNEIDVLRKYGVACYDEMIKKYIKGEI